MRSTATGVAATIALVCAGAAFAAGPALQTDKQKLGYTVGYQIGHSLKTDGLDVDVQALNQAIADVLTGAEPRMSEEEMQAAIETFQARMMAEREQAAEENLQAGEAFLAQNKQREGVVETPSGLQYEVEEEGSGRKPTDNDTVMVHYRGTLIDGTEFDSSYNRGEPVTFPVNGVIQGWREVLPLMQEGAKWRVYIPSQLGYGSRGAGQDIPPNSALIFDIELLSVEE